MTSEDCLMDCMALVLDRTISMKLDTTTVSFFIKTKNVSSVSLSGNWLDLHVHCDLVQFGSSSLFSQILVLLTGRISRYIFKNVFPEFDLVSYLHRKMLLHFRCTLKP
jgi:hypothetical protein